MKNYIFIILSLLYSSACQSDVSDKTRIDETKPASEKRSNDIIKSDSVDEPLLTDKKINPDPKKNADNGNQEGAIIETIDKDVYLGDPFEDPDYIGTPCGDYINGVCTRHPHHKDEFLDVPDVKIDSL